MIQSVQKRQWLTVTFFGLTQVVWALSAFASPCDQQEDHNSGAEVLFQKIDRNKNGFLESDEWPPALNANIAQRIDTNRDGKISRSEYLAFPEVKKGRENKTTSPNGNSQRLPKRTTVKKNLVYASVGGRDLPLDLYLPDCKEPTPLIFWIHGGGWQSGSKKSGGPGLFRLLDQGYAVASVEYRLSGEAIFPAAIEDCKAAVSFLRLNASDYNLDPQRFGAWGASAGGHLVSLLGTTGDTSEFTTHPVTRSASSKIQAVCNWFGPSDFLRMNDFPGVIDHDAPNSPESRFIGSPIQEVPEQTKRANPARYASVQDPPFLHIHGDRDRLVPFNQSEILHRKLLKAGGKSTLHKVIGGGHGFGGSDGKAKKLIEKSVRFFDNHLMRKAP